MSRFQVRNGHSAADFEKNCGDTGHITSDYDEESSTMDVTAAFYDSHEQLWQDGHALQKY